ncbi:MAG: cell division protein FtsA [Prevotellaceae bacterium]|nr:cell division protein FtsA [Prevotellaceae bacterium]
MATKEFIVAIELGSSKVTGIAGQKNLDGSINVLAVVKEESSSFIRRGVAYNIDKTALCIANIVKKLTNQLKTEITKVYVGVGGQSIRSVRNVISKDLPADTKVTEQMVIDLMDANDAIKYSDQEKLSHVIQEYKVDSQYQIDPVGIQCSHLEGNFLNILQRYTFYKNLNKCFENAGVNVAEMFIAPIALADSVLTETEKRSGCALVDIGAETTTVCVYNKNILRHLAVIPLGSRNITKDIASLQIEEGDAEKMKIKYGCAYTDNADIDNNLVYPIDKDRVVDSRKFIEIVEGRLEEIIENVWNQIPSDYYEKLLLGGIILTGGGSNIKNIEKAFCNYTHLDKIRVAKFVNYTVKSNNADINAKNGMMNTLLGLLIKGDQNCAGVEIDPTNLFDTNNASSLNGPVVLGQRAETGKKSGTVPTEAEKRKAEEEAQRRREEEERRREEEQREQKRLAEEEKKRKDEERKRNSPINKGMRWLKKVVKEMTTDE